MSTNHAIRLIALDLDGTLLDSHSQMSGANRSALREAAGRGVRLVVTTGRRFHSAAQFVEQIPCPVTVISSNGARIGTSNGELLHRNFLPRSVAQRVIELARDFRPYTVAIFDMEGRGQLRMHSTASKEGPLGWYLRSAPECLAQVDDLAAAVSEDPIQVMFGGPPLRITPIEPILRAWESVDRIHISWTKYPERDTYLLDVMNQGCSKGAALAWWAERCGVPPEAVMAIGDNFNDVEMFEFAGYPVLMANSTPGLAPHDGRTWHSTASNDEDGVAAAIRRLVLR
jgi:Cof subfamily protein (haloacid dehalogenase superfamily)